MTTSGHLTPHGQFPARSLRPRAAAGHGYIWPNVDSITVAAGMPLLKNAGHARRYLLHAEPKRTANYKIWNIRKETKI